MTEYESIKQVSLSLAVLSLGVAFVTSWLEQRGLQDVGYAMLQGLFYAFFCGALAAVRWLPTSSGLDVREHTGCRDVSTLDCLIFGLCIFYIDYHAHSSR